MSARWGQRSGNARRQPLCLSASVAEEVPNQVILWARVVDMVLE